MMSGSMRFFLSLIDKTGPGRPDLLRPARVSPGGTLRFALVELFRRLDQ